MIYRVADTVPVLETSDVQDVIDRLIEPENYDASDEYFEDWINDIYHGAEIGGYSFTAYEIITKFDLEGEFVEAFQESRAESDSEEARWDLEHASPGDHVWVAGHRVDCYEGYVLDEEESNIYEIDPKEVFNTGDTDGDKAILSPLDMLRLEVKKESTLREKATEAEEEQKNSYFSMYQTLGR